MLQTYSKWKPKRIDYKKPEPTAWSCKLSQLFQWEAKSNINAYFWPISRNTLPLAPLTCLLYLPKYQTTQAEKVNFCLRTESGFGYVCRDLCTGRNRDPSITEITSITSITFKVCLDLFETLQIWQGFQLCSLCSGAHPNQKTEVCCVHIQALECCRRQKIKQNLPHKQEFPPLVDLRTWGGGGGVSQKSL